jgi:hypothetical protein
MGLRYSPDGTAIHRPKSGVGVVGCEVGRVELNYNCSPAALRKKPAATATATEGGVTKLKRTATKTATAMQTQVGGWRGWSWSGASAASKSCFRSCFQYSPPDHQGQVHVAIEPDKALKYTF